LRNYPPKTKNVNKTFSLVDDKSVKISAALLHAMKQCRNFIVTAAVENRQTADILKQLSQQILGPLSMDIAV
jgi:hypothetical protein